MDLSNTLRNMSQNVDNDIVNRINEECNINNFAQRVMEYIEWNAKREAEEGNRSAKSHYLLWSEKKAPWESNRGLLGEFQNKDRAADLFLQMLSKYIPDKNIKLMLVKGCNEHLGNYCELKVSIEW